MPNEKNQKNEITPKGNEMTTKVNASVNFMLFKNPFVAALEKNDTTMMLLLAPSDTSGRKAIKVGEIIADIKNMLGKGDDDPEIKSLEADMETNIQNVTEGEGGVNSISVTIQQAFLYYEKTADSSKMEYAFSLKLNTEKLLSDLDGLFSINSASIAVWNTNRKKILDTMAIFGIEDFLSEYEEAE